MRGVMSTLVTRTLLGAPCYHQRSEIRRAKVRQGRACRNKSLALHRKGQRGADKGLKSIIFAEIRRRTLKKSITLFIA